MNIEYILKNAKEILEQNKLREKYSEESEFEKIEELNSEQLDTSTVLAEEIIKYFKNINS